MLLTFRIIMLFTLCHLNVQGIDRILYSYVIPVCSIVKTITRRCHERPNALLHEAEVHRVMQGTEW